MCIWAVGKFLTHSTNYSWFQTFAMFWMLYAFFWVIPQHLNFTCQPFETLCLFHLHRRVMMGVENVGVFIHQHSQSQLFFIPTCLQRWNRPCSETLAYKIQTPGNYPEESIQYSIIIIVLWYMLPIKAIFKQQMCIKHETHQQAASLASEGPQC